MINLGNGKFKSLDEITRALRLEQLVKESTTAGNPPIIAGYLLQLIQHSENS